MKQLVILAVIGFLAACNQKLPSTGNFGAKITEEGAITADALMAMLGEGDEVKGKVSGTIVKVCQSKGCWYTMNLENGETFRVITKDHDYGIPKDASGKTAIAEGVLRREVTSVERLKHLAEDENKSPDEIAQITEPKVEYEFEADGIIIR